jgi:hypothetical protein
MHLGAWVDIHAPRPAITRAVRLLGGSGVRSFCRRKYWSDHPHGATVFTTVALAAAGLLGIFTSG